jgi:hypothetical protein
MAMLGLNEAARLVGCDVSTLHRAMASGRLSFTKDANGKRCLDPAELERVFGIKGGVIMTAPSGNGADPARNAPAAMHGNEAHGDVQRIEPQPSESERIIAAQRQTIEHQAETIRHLRGLLETEVTERRAMMALLTGPRVPPVQARGRQWWRRWFR